jgi:hypothetical protein
MSAAAEQSNFPTMIIPRGTEIKVNASGQLSIKTPGNLVIQNSGVYSELESTNGSIRIEENVTVEAVSVRAAQACFVQGTLTAWRVHAKRIALEDRAKAFIMLQESEQLELSRTARLVGNFSNEKELFLMMGKFSPQLKEIPGSVDMSSPTPLAEGRPPAPPPPSYAAAPPPPPPPPAAPREDHDSLRQALSLLDREMSRPEVTGHEVDSLRDLLNALRDQNTARVGSIYREAFGEIRNPTEGLRQVYELLEQHFRR